MMSQDKQITIANRFIYYYASFIRGIYGFALRRKGKTIPGQRYTGHMKGSGGGKRYTDPAIDEIVLFRYRKRLILGYCRGVPDRLASPVQVVAEDQRHLRFHRHSLVYLTGISVAEDRGALRTFAASVRELSTELDLGTIWDLVREDREALSIQEIADLYWEGEIDALRWVALYLHLGHACPYFEVLDGGAYVPLSTDSVAARKRLQQLRESLGYEWDEFLHWLAVGEEEPYDPETLTKRQQTWLEGLRQYALWGTRAQNWKRTREILSELPAKAGNRQQQAFRLLVGKGVWEDEEDLELERAEIPLRFSAEVLQMAEDIDIVEALADRKRLHRHIFLLGDEDQREPELAISFRRRWWRRDYELGMHLPDIASLVPPGSALDRAASDRMAALALPDRYLPMLPPRIGEELGRLKTGELRPSLSVLCVLNRSLDVTSVRILPSAIVVREVLTSRDTEAILAGQEHPLGKNLRELSRLAGKLWAKRAAAGAVRPFGLPEKHVTVREGEIDVLVTDPQAAASRVVRELILMAVVAAGDYCRAQGLPAAYETQEDLAARAALEDTPNPVVRRHEIRRQMPPVALSPDPGSHRGLGISGVACMASPLERYPDLVVQRQVLQHLLHGETIHGEEEIHSIRYRAQEELREMDALKHRCERYWLLKHLSARHELIAGVVLHLRRDGALVELLDYPLKIVLHADRSVSLGDEVQIRLSGVDLWSSEAFGSIV